MLHHLVLLDSQNKFDSISRPEITNIRQMVYLHHYLLTLLTHYLTLHWNSTCVVWKSFRDVIASC